MPQVFGLLFVILYLVAPESFASPAPQGWPQVNQLIQAGNLDQAYQVLLAHPEGGAVYYYDLGTLAFRLGRIGPAVAYLEKANRFQPHDPDIQQNLKIARDSLSRAIGTDLLDPASSGPERLVDPVAMKEIRGALGLISLILALYWTLSLLKGRPLRRAFLSPSSQLGLLALVLVVGLYAMKREARDHPAAVSLNRETVRSGPGESFSDLGRVDAGAKVRLLGRRSMASSPEREDEDLLKMGLGADPPPASGSESWLQVRFASDEVGWLPESDLVILN